MIPQRDEIMPIARAVLERHANLRLGLLFGSSARGTALESSDIDVAVAGRNVDLATLASQLSIALGREVDVVSVEADPPVMLLRELLRDAVCLYEAEPGAEAAFRARAVWAVETDGPMVDAMARSYIRRLASKAPP
jgi:predicted nucleotidyltransferase